MKRKRKPERFSDHSIQLRITSQQYAQLNQRFKRSNHKFFVAFLRDVLDREPEIVKYRNASIDDALPLILDMRNSLEAIEMVFHRIVADLRTRLPTDDVSQTLSFMLKEELAARGQIEEVKCLFIKLYEQWLQYGAYRASSAE